jgi:hypothetical protein
MVVASVLCWDMNPPETDRVAPADRERIVTPGLRRRLQPAMARIVGKTNRAQGWRAA